ncbi:hypothetical protein [Rossellomorea marisflavi]
MKQLENNPNVLRVSDQTISYQSSFKLIAVEEYQKGNFLSGFYRTLELKWLPT